MKYYLTASCRGVRVEPYGSHAKGPAAVALEVILARSQGKEYVSRRLFFRMCRRAESSQSAARGMLREMGLIGPRESLNYGAYLRFDPVEWMTYDEWREHGKTVRRGAVSVARDVLSEQPLFNDYQVHKL